MGFFYKDIKKFSEKMKKKMDEIVVVSISKLNENVIYKTPVDNGIARGGWVASIGSIGFSGGFTDKSGQSTISKANNIALMAPRNIYYLSNSVSYINMLEYGLYTKNPQKGTYNKKTGSFEIRSSGGYSKLAPQGMVRISVIEFKQYVKESIRGL